MNLIIQTTVPSYRLNFYNYLVKNNKSIKIISGDDYYTPTVVSDKRTPNVFWVKNTFLFNRKFLFQNLPLKEIIKAKNVVIEFNLRNISFYMVVFLRVILFKSIYFWGHAWSRKGKKSKSEYIRYFFKKLANGYIAYTINQKKELENQLKNKKIYAACNSIYHKVEMKPLDVEIEFV